MVERSNNISDHGQRNRELLGDSDQREWLQRDLCGNVGDGQSNADGNDYGGWSDDVLPWRQRDVELEQRDRQSVVSERIAHRRCHQRDLRSDRQRQLHSHRHTRRLPERSFATDHGHGQLDADADDHAWRSDHVLCTWKRDAELEQCDR